MNLDTDIICFTKINSKWITDVNVKCKYMKFLQDNIEKNLGDFGFVNDFLGVT